MPDIWTWFLVTSGTSISLLGLIYMVLYGPTLTVQNATGKIATQKVVAYYGMMVAFVGQVMSFWPTLNEFI
jgi:hypothetical protein